MRSLNKLLFVSVLFCCSCSPKDKVESAINGWWSIDTIYYNKYDVKVCLNLNSITFNNKGVAIVPTTDIDCAPVITQGTSSKAQFNIIESKVEDDTIPFRIAFRSANELFHGDNKIVFYRDPTNQLLKMEIYSKKLYMVCRKGLFDYRSNEKFTKDLEKITWTNRL